MVELVYLAFCIGGRIRDSIKKRIDDVIAKEETYDPEIGIYRDSQSKIYDANTGLQMFHTFDSKGHSVYEDASRTTRIDLTQIQIDKDIEQAKRNRKNGVTVIELNEGFAYTKKDRSSVYGCEGTRYLDLDNGKIYVIRNWSSMINNKRKGSDFIKQYNSHIPISSFYMDVTNGMLVRVIDQTYEKYIRSIRSMFEDCNNCEKIIKEKVNQKKKIDDEWIRKHNIKQLKMIKDGLKEIEPLHFYHNSFARG